jgi:hypothetical protein
MAQDLVQQKNRRVMGVLVVVFVILFVVALSRMLLR